MFAIGVDLIEIERVARSMERFGQRFLNRVFTEREQRYCNGRVQSLAARFAAKEAVGKALGTGIGDVRWLDIEVMNDEDCRPSLILQGAAAIHAHQQGLDSWAISLSHSETHAIAMVVALRSQVADRSEISFLDV